MYRLLVYIFFIGFSFVICSEERDRKLAKYHHDTAIKLSQNEDYSSSRGYFRSACRLHNSSALYWNDLGVTELRTGEFDKAKRRFQRALDIDSSFQTPQNNLKELAIHQKKPYIPYVPNVKKQIIHQVDGIPTYTKEEFLSIMSGKNARITSESLLSKPFIVKTLIKGYRKKAYFELKNLRKRHGKETVDFYPHNMIYDGSRPLYQPLKQALEEFPTPYEIYHEVDISEAGTYIQWNLRGKVFQKMFGSMNTTLPPIFLEGLSWLPAVFPSYPTLSNEETLLLEDFYQKTHWKMLLIGEDHAGMFLHQDLLWTSSWQIQSHGAKKWHLCDHSQAPFLYTPGEVDMFAPNYGDYPLVRHAHCMEGVVAAGDLIFYPGSYWHQTVNLHTPSIAISSSLLQAEYVEKVIEELEKECQGANRIFATTNPIFCETLRGQFFPAWRTYFPQLMPSTKWKRVVDEL
jgi:tetratricopeptide (TPR) repeat protein